MIQIKSKLLAKMGVFNIIFRIFSSTVTYSFYYLVEFSINFPAIYVNIKINLSKIKKTLEIVFKMVKPCVSLTQSDIRFTSA